MGTRKRATAALPPVTPRPAGMQHMGVQLYALIRQAILEQANSAVLPERPPSHLVGAS